MIHPAWFKNVRRYDVILQPLFHFRTVDMLQQAGNAKEHSTFEHKQLMLWKDAHFRTEPLILDSYKYFLSAVIGILQEQLQTANALQNKVLGGLVALFVFMGRVVFASWWEATTVLE